MWACLRSDHPMVSEISNWLIDLIIKSFILGVFMLSISKNQFVSIYLLCLSILNELIRHK